MMKSLELKIPPPVLALVIALLMWSASRLTVSTGVFGTTHVLLVTVLAGIGLSLDLLALSIFIRLRTSINPMQPHVASSMVTSGVYRVSRNPMYLGLTFSLSAWAAYLWFVWAFLGPVLFIAYITRFQILPEEKALTAMFGEEYEAYMKKVRRWL